MADLPASIPEALQQRLGNGDDPFVVGVDFRLTFAEADARSAELAGRLLASGVGKGSRIGLLFANGSAWAVTWKRPTAPSGPARLLICRRTPARGRAN